MTLRTLIVGPSLTWALVRGATMASGLAPEVLVGADR